MTEGTNPPLPVSASLRRPERLFLLGKNIFLALTTLLHYEERGIGQVLDGIHVLHQLRFEASNVSQVNSLQRAWREWLEWHMSLTIDSGATGSFVNGEPGSSLTESSSPRPRQPGRPRGSRQTARPTTPQIGRIYLPSGRERLTLGGRGCPEVAGGGPEPI